MPRSSRTLSTVRDIREPKIWRTTCTSNSVCRATSVMSCHFRVACCCSTIRRTSLCRASSGSACASAASSKCASTSPPAMLHSTTVPTLPKASCRASTQSTAQPVGKRSASVRGPEARRAWRSASSSSPSSPPPSTPATSGLLVPGTRRSRLPTAAAAAVPTWASSAARKPNASHNSPLPGGIPAALPSGWPLRHFRTLCASLTMANLSSLEFIMATEGGSGAT
mmetsp:Transcript_106597/g.267204  ORF Transcript_106597/g.267204 Transcript_106597/m.267204 type:complete len:224 (+) Transcript_106597:1418-2089(+)